MLNKVQLKNIIHQIMTDALYGSLVDETIIVDKYFMEFLMVQDEARKMNSEEIFNMRGQIIKELHN